MEATPPSHALATELASSDAVVAFLHADSKTKARLRPKLTALIHKTCIPKAKKNREWKRWPSQGRVLDALRIVDAMRDSKFRRSNQDEEKIMTADLVLELCPNEQNKVDRLFGLVVESIADHARELEPTLTVHNVRDTLAGTRYSRGHGIVIRREHADKFAETLAMLEGRLKTMLQNHELSPTSPCLSDTILE